MSRTIPYLNTLSRTIPYLNTLRRTISYVYTLSRAITYLHTLSRTITYLNTLGKNPNLAPNQILVGNQEHEKLGSQSESSITVPKNPENSGLGWKTLLGSGLLSARYSLSYYVEALPAPLPPQLTLLLLFSLRNYSVLWDKNFDRKSWYTPSYIIIIHQSFRYPNFSEIQKGLHTRFLGTVGQKNFDGKSWHTLPPSFFISLKVFDNRIFLKHRRVLLRNVSVPWDKSNFVGNSWYRPLFKP